MNICPYCYEECPIGRDTCPSCHQTVGGRCAECGAWVWNGWKNCQSCGGPWTLGMLQMARLQRHALEQARKAAKIKRKERVEVCAWLDSLSPEENHLEETSAADALESTEDDRGDSPEDFLCGGHSFSWRWRRHALQLEALQAVNMKWWMMLRGVVLFVLSMLWLLIAVSLIGLPLAVVASSIVPLLMILLCVSIPSVAGLFVVDEFLARRRLGITDGELERALESPEARTDFLMEVQRRWFESTRKK